MALTTEEVRKYLDDQKNLTGDDKYNLSGRDFENMDELRSAINEVVSAKGNQGAEQNPPQNSQETDSENSSVENSKTGVSYKISEKDGKFTATGSNGEKVEGNNIDELNQNLAKSIRGNTPEGELYDGTIRYKCPEKDPKRQEKMEAFARNFVMEGVPVTGDVPQDPEFWSKLKEDYLKKEGNKAENWDKLVAKVPVEYRQTQENLQEKAKENQGAQGSVASEPVKSKEEIEKEKFAEDFKKVYGVDYNPENVATLTKEGKYVTPVEAEKQLGDKQGIDKLNDNDLAKLSLATREAQLKVGDEKDPAIKARYEKIIAGKDNMNDAILKRMQYCASGFSMGSDYDTYKKTKSSLQVLHGHSPELQKNFSKTMNKANDRLNPPQQTTKLYKGDMKKGFINSVIYNNFYRSGSWGKKNIIQPWRKFKRKAKKTFNQAIFGTEVDKLARIQTRDDVIKAKLWVKAIPSRMKNGIKNLWQKGVNKFKQSKLGKKLTELNNKRKELGRKIKEKTISVAKTVGHGLAVGAKYATMPIWGPPYLAYKGGQKVVGMAKNGINTAKAKVDNVQKNIKDGMQASVDSANQDRARYAQRNPHPYEKLNEEQQKSVNQALKAYGDKAQPYKQADGLRKDTTQWAPEDVERQAAAEMLDKLIQPKDKGGIELPKEQAKEIVDFFNKQGLMKSTYDNIAKDEKVTKPVEENAKKPEEKSVDGAQAETTGKEEQKGQTQQQQESQAEKESKKKPNPMNSLEPEQKEHLGQLIKNYHTMEKTAMGPDAAAKYLNTMLSKDAKEGGLGLNPEQTEDMKAYLGHCGVVPSWKKGKTKAEENAGASKDQKSKSATYQAVKRAKDGPEM